MVLLIGPAGELEGYDRIAARLRPGFGGGGNWVRDFLLSSPSDDGVSSGPLLRAGTVLDIQSNDFLVIQINSRIV